METYLEIDLGEIIIQRGCVKRGAIVHTREERIIHHQIAKWTFLKPPLLLAAIYLRLQILYGRHRRKRYRKQLPTFSKMEILANQNGCVRQLREIKKSGKQQQRDDLDVRNRPLLMLQLQMRLLCWNLVLVHRQGKQKPLNLASRPRAPVHHVITLLLFPQGLQRE